MGLDVPARAPLGESHGPRRPFWGGRDVVPYLKHLAEVEPARAAAVPEDPALQVVVVYIGDQRTDQSVATHKQELLVGARDQLDVARLGEMAEGVAGPSEDQKGRRVLQEDSRYQFADICRGSVSPAWPSLLIRQRE